MNNKERYQKSTEMFHKVSKYIPLASQTFSKSVTQYPLGASPLFIKNGKGSHVWDIDGNEYIDFVNGLLSVSIGYQIEKIDNAVKEQLKNGVSFSLPHLLEYEVAKKIVDIVPCAEMVRFSKNGSDATTGAIRLARAYTGREQIAICGYHGWHDWYISTTTRDLGIPEFYKSICHKFLYNDLGSLENLFKNKPNQIAAVIMEPMNIEYPEDNFLDKVKKIAHDNGALLIFDETITGFRFSKGGAQEEFNVTPDLATFGKGVANGFPLSILTGKKEIMKRTEDVFLSGTFGGETLSLAASSAVLDMINKNSVCEEIKKKGQYLQEELSNTITNCDCQSFIKVKGHPTWSFLVLEETNGFDVSILKTYLLQELFKRGFIFIGTHNLSYSHTKEDIDKLIMAYRDIFPVMKKAILDSSITSKLECDPLIPVFKVR